MHKKKGALSGKHEGGGTGHEYLIFLLAPSRGRGHRTLANLQEIVSWTVTTARDAFSVAQIAECDAAPYWAFLPAGRVFL